MLNSLRVIATRYGVHFDFGSSYASFHQVGAWKRTKHYGRKLPARPISPRYNPRKGPIGGWLREVKKTLQEYVTSGRAIIHKSRIVE